MLFLKKVLVQFSNKSSLIKKPMNLKHFTKTMCTKNIFCTLGFLRVLKTSKLNN